MIARASSVAVGIALLGITGCGMIPSGVPEGFTEVRFAAPQKFDLYYSLSSGGFSTAAYTAMNGGVWIYAFGANGNPFSRNFYFADDTHPEARTLPNGDYIFAAFAYETAGLGPTGTIKCAYANGLNPVNLAGAGPVTISLNFTEAGCVGTIFFPGSYNNGTTGFPLHINSCSPTGFPGAAPNGDCTSTNAGSISGVEIDFPLFVTNGTNFIVPPPDGVLPPAGVLKSGCINMSGGFSSGETIKIPMGDSSLTGGTTKASFATGVRAYTGGGCTTLYAKYFFPFGLANPGDSKVVDPADAPQTAQANYVKYGVGSSILTGKNVLQLRNIP